MNTRLLMTASAAFMAILGAIGSFLPQETLAYAGVDAPLLAVLLVQAAGALYLGFAMLNWMARGVLIGGIYARPLAMGNLLHFVLLGVTLARALVAEFSVDLALLTLPYAVFAALFGFVVFNPPAAVK